MRETVVVVCISIDSFYDTISIVNGIHRRIWTVTHTRDKSISLSSCIGIRECISKSIFIAILCSSVIRIDEAREGIGKIVGIGNKV